MSDPDAIAAPHASDPAVEGYLTWALQHPDPHVRLSALDIWAQYPGETLDPVTYALVDPDESVRARAQELFEQTLTRE